MIKLIRKIADRLTRPDPIYKYYENFYSCCVSPVPRDPEYKLSCSPTFYQNQYQRVSQNYFGVWRLENAWLETNASFTPFNGSITLSNEVE